MRHKHDTYVYDDSGRKIHLETGQDTRYWTCDFCGTTNDRGYGAAEDDWPTCLYCGRFRDDDVDITYGWYEE